MEYSIHRISLDIHSVKPQASIRVKRADTCRKIHITLCEDGHQYHIADGCSATFSALKPDGKYLYNDCQVVGDTIIYTFTEQTTAVAGCVECEVALYNSKGQRLTSPRFILVVDDRVYNGEEIISSAEATALEKLIDEANEAISNTNEAIENTHAAIRESQALFANAFKGTATGSVVTVDDVSPLEHTVECRVTSKNLLNLSQSRLTNCTYNESINGITSDITGAYYCSVWANHLNEIILANKGKTFTFSVESSVPDRVISVVVWGVRTDGKATQEENGTKGGNSVSITIDDVFTSINSVELRLNRNANNTFTDTNSTFANLQFELGTQATEFVPYVNPDSVTVTVASGNKTQTYTPGANGIVDGILSHYPSMTISTDNENAIVTCTYNKDSNKVLNFAGGVPGGVARIGYVTLLASKWQGATYPYSQVVEVEGVTENSQVDLTPSVEQLAIFHNKDLAFVTENEGGVVTVYAIGDKPKNDYTIQATITEVII